MVYLARDAPDFSEYKTFINSKEGFALVQEIQEIEKNRPAAAAAAPGFDLREELTDHMMETYGKKSHGHFTKKIKSPNDIIDLCVKSIKDNSNSWYYIGIYGPYGGHGIAVRTTRHGVNLFDPNLGEFRFNDLTDLIGYIASVFIEKYNTTNAMWISRYKKT